MTNMLSGTAAFPVIKLLKGLVESLQTVMSNQIPLNLLPPAALAGEEEEGVREPPPLPHGACSYACPGVLRSMCARVCGPST